jgi:hypothetical protein
MERGIFLCYRTISGLGTGLQMSLSEVFRWAPEVSQRVPLTFEFCLIICVVSSKSCPSAFWISD